MRKIFLSVLLLLNIVVLFKVLSVTSFFFPSRYQPDFDSYYRIVADIRRGIDPYSVSYMQTLGPPLVFLYFYPFSLFSLPTAQFLNLLINLLSGYLTCLVLALYLRRRLKNISLLSLSLLLLLPFWGTFLSRYSLQIGQPHLLITFLISLVITTPRFRRLFLCTLFSLKTFFILPLISYFISHKSYLPMITTPLLVVLVSLVIIRPSWYLDYTFHRFGQLQFFSPATPTGELMYENQTLKATLLRLGLPSVYPYLYLFLIALAIFYLLRAPTSELAFLFSFLLSPVLWQHYFIALFPIYVKSFKQSYPHRMPTVLLLLSIVLWYPDLRLWYLPPNFFTGLLASHFFIALCLLTLAQIPRLRYNPNTQKGLLV